LRRGSLYLLDMTLFDRKAKHNSHRIIPVVTRSSALSCSLSLCERARVRVFGYKAVYSSTRYRALSVRKNRAFPATAGEAIKLPSSLFDATFLNSSPG